MKSLLKKFFFILVIVAVYFALWRDFRAMVTTYTVLPQIEYSIQNCEKYSHVDQDKSTSFDLYVYNSLTEEYDYFRYTTPAGFYFLFGMVMIVILKSSKIHYQLMVGLHVLLWLFTILIFLPALCLYPPLLHFNTIAIKYISPFLTFLIITMVLSPQFQNRLNI